MDVVAKSIVAQDEGYKIIAGFCMFAQIGWSLSLSGEKWWVSDRGNTLSINIGSKRCHTVE